MNRFFLSLIILVLLTISAEAANRFAVCSTTCTWDGTSTAMWSTSTGGATGASVPGAADAVIFDGATCVGGTTCIITVNTSPNILSLTMGACTASTTGCVLDFSANNNSIAMTLFSGTGTGTRTLKMGSGTWSVTGSGTFWTIATSTNLTLTPGASNLVFQVNAAAGGTFNTASSLTYGHITINGNASTGGPFIFTSNAFTVGTLSISAPNFISIPVSPNSLTITNAINWSGTASQPIRVQGFCCGFNQGLMVVANGSTLTYASLYSTNWTGTTTATNSFDNGRNTGAITINGTFAGGSSGCILGGWLLWRDFDPANDNLPAVFDEPLKQAL